MLWKFIIDEIYNGWFLIRDCELKENNVFGKIMFKVDNSTFSILFCRKEREREKLRLKFSFKIYNLYRIAHELCTFNISALIFQDMRQMKNCFFLCFWIVCRMITRVFLFVDVPRIRRWIIAMKRNLKSFIFPEWNFIIGDRDSPLSLE